MATCLRRRGNNCSENPGSSSISVSDCVTVGNSVVENAAKYIFPSLSFASLNITLYGVLDLRPCFVGGGHCSRFWTSPTTYVEYFVASLYDLLTDGSTPGQFAVEAILAGCAYISPTLTRPMEGIYSPQQYFLAQNAGDEYVCSFEQKVTSANFNIPSRTSNNIAGPALAVSAVSLIHQTCNLLVLGFPSQFWLRFYTSMIDVHTGWHALRVISVSPANTQRGIIFIVATVRKKQLKHLNIGFCHLFYRIATLQLSAHGQLWSANFPHSCRQSSPRRLTPRRSNEFLSR